MKKIPSYVIAEMHFLERDKIPFNYDEKNNYIRFDCLDKKQIKLIADRHDRFIQHHGLLMYEPFFGLMIKFVSPAEPHP